jgi:hypothetical protein
MFIIGLLVFSIGIIMILGTSYSLITNQVISNETYGFNVANFDVSFNDDKTITISSIPMSDEEGIKDSKEYVFTINNNGDYTINYRLDILENSSYNMKDVIHYIYSVNDSEYSEVYTLKDNYTINQNKTLKTNTADEYKIKMWLSADADESYMNKSFSASIIINATQNEYKYASSVIEKLGNERKDNVTRVGVDYRYSKDSAPNYVWFNCQDGFTKGNDYCEKWRIIGSFYNKSNLRSDLYPSLKIISTKPYIEIAYDDEDSDTFDASYINSFANGYYYDKLSSSTQYLILKAKWNIGDVTSNKFDDVLKEETLNTYYANIGLPNISDYIYLDDESYFSENMMFINKTNNNVNILNNGIKKGNNLTNYSFVPCLYLRADVSIVSGDGSIDNPYELKIKYPLNY